VLSGLIACWFGLDPLVRWCMSRRWFVWLSAFAFMIYAMHTPAVAYLTEPVLQWLSPLPAARLLGYLLLPVMIIAACVVIGALLRAALPKVYSVLTGGRGVAR
jgi:hypothetical protein